LLLQGHAESKPIAEARDPKTGMPVFTEEEQANIVRSSMIRMPFATLTLAAINFGLACLIFFFGDRVNYIMRINGLVANDQHWLFLGAYIFSRLVTWLNAFPVAYKEAVMKGGNFRNNAYIY
jgi:hypothetical protein